jgi:hypothetical protein
MPRFRYRARLPPAQDRMTPTRPQKWQPTA